jgi:peptidoglycan L-alanyl-D-glutamate endopeptidase CwlK
MEILVRPTTAAVIAFQRSEGLLADGIAGERTKHALGLLQASTLPSVIPGVTVTVVSRMFPVTHVDNIKANLPFVCNGLKEKELVDKPMVLMALATIRAETESFEPISEGNQIQYLAGRRPLTCTTIAKTWAIKVLATAKFADADTFSSWSRELPKYGQALSKDLINSPALANDPTIAGQLLATFLKDKEKANKRGVS